MRLLHEVSEEEALLCRGQYKYYRKGEPTGQVETWQVTELPNGDTITRSDIEGVGSTNPVNLLSHLRRDNKGRPKWLRIRYERNDFIAAAQYTFEHATVEIARQAEGYSRMQDKLDIASNYEVDYHAVIAHEYVWRGYPRHARGKQWSIPIISPDLWVDGRDVLGGRIMRFNVTPLEESMLETPVGTFEAIQHFEVILSDDVQALAWYDEHGIPLRWYYPEKDYDFVLESYIRADEEDKQAMESKEHIE